MAAPAAITLAVKAAIAAAADKRAWKTLGVVIAAILTPFILIAVMLTSLLSGASGHNNAAIVRCFTGANASPDIPAEYAAYISNMSDCFAELDKAVSQAEAGMEGRLLDSILIKSVFYSLYFGDEKLSLSQAEARAFVGCFVACEGKAAVPASLDAAYASLAASGIMASGEDKANAREIYSRMSCGGAGAYGGTIEYGGAAGTELEALSFTDPTTKNSLDLAAYAKNALACGWGYVWGTYGEVLTEMLLSSKLEQYADGVGSCESVIRQHWLGRRTTDCAGLIKGYGWLNPNTLEIEYCANGMPDISADRMYESAAVSGPMDAMPDVPGLAVWKPGHVGVYIGNGEVIEAMGTKYGVVKTKLTERSWTAWFEIPYISYSTE